MVPSTKTDADFPEKSTIIQNHEERPDIISISYATWNDPIVTFSENEDPDGIEISLLGTPMKWIPKGILQDGNHYTLSGQLDISGSYLSISSNTNGIEGVAKLGGGKIVEIIPLGGNDILLVETETDEISCALPDSEPESNIFCLEPSNCQAIVSILVVAGQSAFNEAASRGINLNSVTQSIASNTNDILRNSGVLNKRIRISFYDTPYNIPGGVPSSNLRTAVTAFRDDPIAHQLRNDYNADMMYYIGGGAEMTGTNGEAYSIYNTQAADAFSMGSLTVTMSSFTATHEFGHLWGCYHENRFPWCPQGYKLNAPAPNGNEIQTVMHQGEGAADRDAIPYFSNPPVKYANEPTGIVGIVECANAVSSNMCRFADFRDTKELEVLIAQDEDTPCHSGASLQANITFPAVGVPGTSIESYQWSYSFSPLFSGSNPGTTFGNGPSAFLPSSIHVFKNGSPITVYVQLTVTTADGVEITWTEAVELCPLTPDELGPIGHLPLRILDEEFKITVFPNPISNSLGTVWVRSNNNTGYEVNLINSKGQRLTEYSLDKSKTAQPLLLPQNLPTGVYYLQATNKDGSTSTATFQLTN